MAATRITSQAVAPISTRVSTWPIASRLSRTTSSLSWSKLALSSAVQSTTWRGGRQSRSRPQRGVS